MILCIKIMTKTKLEISGDMNYVKSSQLKRKHYKTYVHCSVRFRKLTHLQPRSVNRFILFTIVSIFLVKQIYKFLTNWFNQEKNKVGHKYSSLLLFLYLRSLIIVSRNMKIVVIWLRKLKMLQKMSSVPWQSAINTNKVYYFNTTIIWLFETNLQKKNALV